MQDASLLGAIHLWHPVDGGGGGGEGGFGQVKNGQNSDGSGWLQEGGGGGDQQTEIGCPQL